MNICEVNDLVEIFNLILETDFEFRVVNREKENIDIFLDIANRAVNIVDECSDFFNSRIQFPKVRAVLLRISSENQNMTVHILRDIDLFSAFANFEIDYSDSVVHIKKIGQYAVIEKTKI